MAFVKFRFRFKGDQPYALLKSCGKEWSKLLSTSFAIKRTASFYQQVSDAHQILPREFSFGDVAEQLSQIDSEKRELLESCRELFDLAPYDLRVYILTALRSTES